MQQRFSSVIRNADNIEKLQSYLNMIGLSRNDETEHNEADVNVFGSERGSSHLISSLHGTVSSGTPDGKDAEMRSGTFLRTSFYRQAGDGCRCLKLQVQFQIQLHASAER